jgi:hypothetical protein
MFQGLRIAKGMSEWGELNIQKGEFCVKGILAQCLNRICASLQGCQRELRNASPDFLGDQRLYRGVFKKTINRLSIYN